MKFLKRLNRYLIGVVIGCLMVAFMFRDREWFSWTPNSQVLKMVEKNYQEPDSTIYCLMRCHKITSDDLMELMDEGEVDFGSSHTSDEIKKYVIQHENDQGLEYSFTFSIEELAGDKKKVVIVGVDSSVEVDCDC